MSHLDYFGHQVGTAKLSYFREILLNVMISEPHGVGFNNSDVNKALQQHFV